MGSDEGEYAGRYNGKVLRVKRPGTEAEGADVAERRLEVVVTEKTI